MGPIPHHMHQSDEHAKLVGRAASPRPTTFRRSTTRSTTTFPTPSWASSRARRKTTCGGASRTGTRATTASCISRAPSGSSPARGWQIDPGILHAPGSLVTYEPQVNSDVFAMFQSEVEGRIIDWSLLTKDVLPDKHTISTTSSACSTGTRTSTRSSRRAMRASEPVSPIAETEAEGYREQWVMLRHAASTRPRS